MTDVAKDTGGQTPPTPQTPQERMAAFLTHTGEEGEPKKRRPPPEHSEGQLDHETTDTDIDGVEDGLDLEDPDLEDYETTGYEEEEEEYDDEGDPTEPGEDDEVDPDSENLWTVKVDGEEVQVTEDELKAGYSRQAHFTRSMQALAREREAFQEEAAAVQEERAQYTTLLPLLRDSIAAQKASRTPEEWAELERSDPITYLTERQKEAERQEKIRDIEAEMEEAQRREAAQQEKLRQQIKVQESQKMLEKVPEWAEDKKLMSSEMKQMADYARSLGYSDEELDGVIDHRLVLLLRDAARYARVRDKRKNLKPSQRSSKSARPGSKQRSPAPKQKRRAREARERARKSGRVEDAAAAMKFLL